MDFLVLVFDDGNQLCHFLFKLFILGINIDHHFLEGWIRERVHWWTSETRSCFVMMSDLSFDSMSFSAISLTVVLLFTWFYYSGTLSFAVFIFLFILVMDEIISWYTFLSSSVNALGSTSSSFSYFSSSSLPSSAFSSGELIFPLIISYKNILIQCNHLYLYEL